MGKRWTKAALKREPAVQKTVDRLAHRLLDLIWQEGAALEADDPKGRCASYHKGAINAYQNALREVYSFRDD